MGILIHILADALSVVNLLKKKCIWQRTLFTVPKSSLRNWRSGRVVCVVRWLFCPGNVNLPMSVAEPANQEIGVPRLVAGHVGRPVSLPEMSIECFLKLLERVRLLDHLMDAEALGAFLIFRSHIA
jgi:hypothetical protein